jgi:hypothetical protein
MGRSSGRRGRDGPQVHGGAAGLPPIATRHTETSSGLHVWPGTRLGCGTMLIGSAGGKATLSRMVCRRWECPRCGPSKARRVAHRISAGGRLGPVSLLTLTSRREPVAESFQELTRRWKRFSISAKRHWSSFEYLAVAEPQIRGNAHLHVVIRASSPPLRSLRASRMASASGFGRIADVSPIQDGAIDSVALYPSPSPNRFAMRHATSDASGSRHGGCPKGLLPQESGGKCGGRSPAVNEKLGRSQHHSVSTFPTILASRPRPLNALVPLARSRRARTGQLPM